MKVYTSLILLCGMLSFLFAVVSATPFEVFLNCSGDDIRKSFSDHLYATLTQTGIRTFREEDGIPRGEKVSLAIKKVLRTSTVVVVVFSKDYLKSTDCLDELVMIMECVQIDGCNLVPVYLNVHWMDVKFQTGLYFEAFAVHEMKLEEKMDRVEKYRTVLREAGDIKGPSLMNGYEAKFIEKVVLEVKITLKKAKPKPASYVSWNNLLLVGSIVLIAIVVTWHYFTSQKKALILEEGMQSSSDASS